MKTPVLQTLQNALRQHPLAYLDDLVLLFEAVDEYLGELAAVNEVLEVVLHGPEEAGPKHHAQIVAVHLVLLLLGDDVVGEEDEHQEEDLLVDVLHLCEDLPDEGELVGRVVGDDLVVDPVVEERKLQVVEDLLETAYVRCTVPHTVRMSC